MSSIMDKSDSMPAPLELDRGPLPRWLLIAHRIVTVIVLLLAVYVVLMAITGAILGGHSLTTRLLFLWHYIHSFWI